MATNKVTRKRFNHVNRVDVLLWGQHIGTVALDPGYGFYSFGYTDEFMLSGIEPSPLSMPLSDETYIFTDLPVATYKRLPSMLSDSLPDDFGNALIDKFMADQGVDAQEVTALDRLAYMGNRAMGALMFKPTKGPAAQKPTAIQLGSLVEQARKAVTGVIDEDHTSAALRSIIEVGTSAGGARAKAVIAINPETHEMRSGQLDAPDGFEHWLLKFDGMGSDQELGSSQDYGRIEYAYHLMARAAGIDMTDCSLLTEGGRAHFMTKRFDREAGNGRHHLQTLCAMAHLDYKKKGTNAYAQFFLTIDRLGLPAYEKEEAFRRMVFNIMARNCDDHTKNHSFILREGSTNWALSPAYDVTFAHNPKGEWTNQHLMSVNGKFSGFNIEDVLTEATRFRVEQAKDIVYQVREALKQWPDFAHKAKLPEKEMHFIRQQLLLLGD